MSLPLALVPPAEDKTAGSRTFSPGVHVLWNIPCHLGLRPNRAHNLRLTCLLSRRPPRRQHPGLRPGSSKAWAVAGERDRHTSMRREDTLNTKYFQKLWTAIWYSIRQGRASLVAQMVKCLPAMWEAHCVLDPWVWKIPWRRKWQPMPVFLPGESHGWKDPGGLQSTGSQRVGHDWAISLSLSHNKEYFLKTYAFRAFEYYLVTWRIPGNIDLNAFLHLKPINKVLRLNIWTLLASLSVPGLGTLDLQSLHQALSLYFL